MECQLSHYIYHSSIEVQTGSLQMTNSSAAPACLISNQHTLPAHLVQVAHQHPHAASHTPLVQQHTPKQPTHLFIPNRHPPLQVCGKCNRKVIGAVWIGRLRLQICVFQPFFFSQCVNNNITWIHCTRDKNHCSRVSQHYSHIKKLFCYSVFNFQFSTLGKISCIQTNPIAF